MATFSRCRSVLGNKVNTTIYYKNTRAKWHINCGKALHSSNIPSNNSYNSRRTFFNLFRRSKLAEIKIKDNVSDEYSLIYRNTMERYILFAQIFTTVSAVVVAFFTVIVYDYDNLKSNKISIQSPGGETQNQRYFYLTTFILFVVILQMLIYKLPIRIYYLSQQKKYTYVFYGSYPFASRKLTCSMGDVMKLPERGISPWKDVKYQIKNEQEVILMESFFKRPADLYIMLGIQRDPDDDDNH